MGALVVRLKAREKEIPMRKLIVHEFVTLDGIMQAPGGPGDNTARVWDAVSGKPLSPPLQHQGGVVSAAFSPDSTRVVTASWDNTARVWDASGKPLSPPLQHHQRQAAVPAAAT